MPATAPTRDRLLDAAERLFVEHGLERTSLRQITGEAGANLAAVNYHFGSRLALVRAVFERRLQPMNAERLRQLDAAEAAAEEAGAPCAELEAILRAFLRPALVLGRQAGGRDVLRLIARAHSTDNPEVQQALLEAFGEVARRFTRALERALPTLPRPEVLWRLHFLVGGLVQTLLSGEILTTFSQGACDVHDEEAVLERLVEYGLAGFRAAVESAS